MRIFFFSGAGFVGAVLFVRFDATFRVYRSYGRSLHWHRYLRTLQILCDYLFDFMKWMGTTGDSIERLCKCLHLFLCDHGMCSNTAATKHDNQILA